MCRELRHQTKAGVQNVLCLPIPDDKMNDPFVFRAEGHTKFRLVLDWRKYSRDKEQPLRKKRGLGLLLGYSALSVAKLGAA